MTYVWILSDPAKRDVECSSSLCSADSLMPTKECAHTGALLAGKAVHWNPDPIFMRFKDLSAHCPSELKKIVKSFNIYQEQ